MKILAIETSCDDTGAAILEVSSPAGGEKFNVLSNIVSSQLIHQNYGGVFPMMAKREHQKNIVSVLQEALSQADLLKVLEKVNSPRGINGEFTFSKTQHAVMGKILEKENTLFENLKEFLQKYEKPFDFAQGKPAIDAIAVTHGPGLEPCLYVGVNFAKALSYFWDLPIVPVNHIEGHILVNFLPKVNENPLDPQGISAGAPQTPNPKTIFPAISLVVSGGHTQLILVEEIGKYKILGETRDDAAGECFDKCAKILGLGYPGGPQIAAKAAISQKNAEINAEQRGNMKFRVIPREIPHNSAISLPRPMMNTKDYDFSFSGLKTAVLYKVRDTKPNVVKSNEFIAKMCVEIQQAIIDVLLKKTLAAAKNYQAKAIILGGGVSANEELRKQFTEKSEIPVIFPDKNLSTDNALMIAVAGYFNKNKKTKDWKKITVNANLRVN